MISAAVLDTIEKLVAIDTTSGRSNLEAIRFIQDRLEQLGATCRLTFDDAGGKANLYATLGPEDRPGVMLSGHTDVVPVEGQTWSDPPFALTRRGDKFYGRGSADMKSFVGLALGLAPEFLARNPVTPLHFSFSYDEEVGCIGVRRLIEDLKGLPVKPRLCIVGEPTEMRIVTGHKGKRSLRCHVHGKEGHSALGLGVNAVNAAAEIIVHIKTLQRRIEQDGPFDPAYTPPYTTLHTGLVTGGTALNIVPKKCTFEYEIRALPSDDPERHDRDIRRFAQDVVEAEMKAKDQETGLAFETMDDTAGFDLSDTHEAVRLVAALTGENGSHKVSFGTEAGLFNDAGVPTVICGPGAIEQAHKPDEFITMDQLERGEAFLRRLMDQLCT